MSSYVDFVDVDCAKNCLQEYCQAQCLPLPVYNLLGKVGPDHSPMFQVNSHVQHKSLFTHVHVQVEVEVNGILYTGEWATKKREAEKLAALEAWITIHRPPSPPKATSTHETNDPCVLLQSMNLEGEQNIEPMDCN